MSRRSTRAITAAEQLPGTAPSPAASEDPMPDRQSGLCTVIAPSSGTSTAPVTTTTGAAPPSRSSATPRSTSRVPATSTSAFGPPSRVPSPAASRTPAICGSTTPNATSCGPTYHGFLPREWGQNGRDHGAESWEVRWKGSRDPVGAWTYGSAVVDAAGGVGEGLAGAAPAELDELSRDRHRRLLGGPGAQVQADRGPQPR